MKNTQRVLCAALAACVTFFSVISPETAQAKRNEQVDGLIFWGTSGMDLLHGDLKTEEARTSMSTGSAESDMHAWFDGSSASDYDAAKQNYFDSSFFGGQYQISGAGSTRSSGSKKGMSLSGFEYNNGSKGAHHDSVMQMIENQISGGWEGKKTFVALWAGEDWILRDESFEVESGSGEDMKLNSKDGFDNREDLQDWMALDVEVADTESDYNEYMKIDMDENAEVDDTVGDGSSVDHHKYVWDNSTILSDDEIAAHTLTAADNGIDYEPKHVLSKPTDEFPKDSSLQQQASQTFAKILSGYTYQCEVWKQSDQTVTEPTYGDTISYTYEDDDGEICTGTVQKYVNGGGGESGGASGAAGWAYSKSETTIYNLNGSVAGTQVTYNWDVPIMEVDTVSHKVNGYAQYWNAKGSQLGDDEGKGAPGVYLFGLGPYTKATRSYEKTRHWTDFLDNTISAFSNDDWTDIKRVEKMDQARKDWNSGVQSGLNGVQFIDIWDVTLDHRPYYRYGNVVKSSANVASSAFFGKWYDASTNRWLFHLMWQTILNQHANPEPDDPVDISLYSASCALTAYANKVLSANGRSSGGGDGADPSATPDPSGAGAGGGSGGAGTADQEGHGLPDVMAAGMANAGSALGYGDTNFGFVPAITTVLSESSSIVDYEALIGIENAAESTGASLAAGVDKGSSLYTYSRYGRLLNDLGLDKTGTEQIVSSRMFPGVIMNALYVGNAALSVAWDISFDLLKLLNPFQFFAAASNIKNEYKQDMAAGTGGAIGSIVSPDTGGLAKLYYAGNGVVKTAFDAVGDLYDFFTGFKITPDSPANPFGGAAETASETTISMASVYLFLFIASFLLMFAAWKRSGRFKSEALKLAVRITFLFIGIPLLGMSYTATLNGIDHSLDVTSMPASQMVSATFVDFQGWVKNARLNPPVDATAEMLTSAGTPNLGAGEGSDKSMSNLRRMACIINKSTNILPSVDVDAVFAPLGTTDPLSIETAEDVEAWNDLMYNTGQTGSHFKTQLDATSEVFGIVMDWSKGEFYYASDFDSEVMANFSNKLNSYVGRRRGTDEGKTDVTEAAPTLDPGAVDPDESAAAMNDNTLYQMFDSTNESDEWLSRTVDENTLILAGEDPAAGREYEEGQNWNLFNIFANGSLTASPDVNVDKTTDVAYTHGTELASAAPDGAVTPLPDLKGLALNYKTGLSTLAMYNYLSTDFTPTGMVIYSPAKSSNGHTVKAHFKVNMVGSGMMEIIFFLNCAAFLLVMVILGLYYTIGMAVSVIKQSFKMILNTPFALMGLLGSIAQVVTIVVTMVIEIIGSIAIYELMSELLFTIVTAFEGPLRESLANVEAASHVGGLLAMMTSAPVEGLAFDARFTAFMCGITLGLFGLSYGAVKLAPAVMRVREKATELFLMKYILNAEQAAGYAENVRRERARREAERERREGEPLGEPVCQGFTAAFHEVITSA